MTNPTRAEIEKLIEPDTRLVDDPSFYTKEDFAPNIITHLLTQIDALREALKYCWADENGIQNYDDVLVKQALAQTRHLEKPATTFGKGHAQQMLEEAKSLNEWLGQALAQTEHLAER
jgi:hypothetical protein